MSLSFKIKSPNGNEYKKTIEEITTDAEAATKKLVAKGIGPNFASCFKMALEKYNDLDEFVNNIYYFRKFVPNARYANTHLMIVEFFQ